MIRERPILFSDAMVRAILAGRKTQTRRAIKPQPVVSESEAKALPAAWESGFIDIRCPYGQPGDRLWVRERFLWRGEWAAMAADESGERPDRVWHGRDPRRGGGPLHECIHYGTDGAVGDPREWRGMPSIHMPRWASRLTLDVTGVRVERLHDISEDDARAEGATSRPRCSGYRNAHTGWSMDWSHVGTIDPLTRRALTESDVSLGTARMAFANLWNEINGDRMPWDANPWVWVVEFRRVEVAR